MLSVEQFGRKHSFSKQEMDWALANCADMMVVWRKSPPELLRWIAIQDYVLTPEQLREMATFCYSRLDLAAIPPARVSVLSRYLQNTYLSLCDTTKSARLMAEFASALLSKEVLCERKPLNPDQFPLDFANLVRGFAPNFTGKPAYREHDDTKLPRFYF